MASPRPVTQGLFTVRDDGPRLLAARCAACKRLQFPANDVCPYCSHDQCGILELDPRATLYLFTTIERPPPGYRGPSPYGFGVVEVSDGLRIVTRLAGLDAVQAREGLPLRLVVEPLFYDDDGTPVLSYAFAPDHA